MNNPHPKKSLGQNFLTSLSALSKIIETAGLSSDDIVLEIGPGKGALTAEILKSGAKVLAIEKDNELVSFLCEKFQKEVELGQLIIRNEDILDLIPEGEPIIKNKYKIIANIPYYITGQIIKKFLTATHKPTKMVLLVQKEVAERIVAKDDKESILSLSVKAYGEPKYILKVSRGSFFPAPNVDSAIILIDNIKENFKKGEEKMFFDILHAGFGQKRKFLLGNLVKVFGNKEKLTEIFNKYKIDLKVRAEDLKLEDWRKITEAIGNL
ncbi:MAG: Ribosomal RNA small subunit methyltransferase A [Parcubacteria group bacterium GW2011_GWF2_38_76]|nr:MAG: Ribosomal RNA small subunit methyltransferase A [Parcubacteria group bacterium GW2011_GWF2_38_76]HBM46138.1 ribosomal RNA small subunit methyltransferase A [Patescibacteria group bacterium]